MKYTFASTDLIELMVTVTGDCESKAREEAENRLLKALSRQSGEVLTIKLDGLDRGLVGWKVEITSPEHIDSNLKTVRVEDDE